MNDFVLAPNCLRVRNVKLVESLLLLEHVLDEASSPVSHLAQSVGQAAMHHVGPRVSLLTVWLLVWHVPHIVGDKLFHALALVMLDKVLLRVR